MTRTAHFECHVFSCVVQVDVDELGDILRAQLGEENVTDSMAEAVMSVMDGDGSGEINFEEYIDWFMNYEQARLYSVCLRRSVGATVPPARGVLSAGRCS